MSWSTVNAPRVKYPELQAAVNSSKAIDVYEDEDPKAVNNDSLHTHTDTSNNQRLKRLHHLHLTFDGNHSVKRRLTHGNLNGLRL